MNEPTCSVPICTRPAHIRGLCDPHYLRLRRHGDVLADVPLRVVPPPLERLFARVDKQGPIPSYRPELGPCWPWTGYIAVSLGYGTFWLNGTQMGTHVAAYRLLVGPIPAGKELDHLCRVRACVKAVANEQGPAHLDPVTHLENMQRSMLPKMRAHLDGICLKGHPLTGENVYVNPASGSRTCKTCKRAYQRARYHNRKAS